MYTPLKKITGHSYVALTTRGNEAITRALSLCKGPLLLAKEGGWMHYERAAKKLGLAVHYIACTDAKLNLADLKKKLSMAKTLLYQQPGGYFAQQPADIIYQICKAAGVTVILDVSGCVGTQLCSSNYADYMVCSFGQWKLIDAGVGGFISGKKPVGEDTLDTLHHPKIQQKIEELPQRLAFVEEQRNKILLDLAAYDIVYPEDYGLVVVVAYKTNDERDRLLIYCKKHNLAFTECPRPIRVNRQAISIEVKRLEA